VYKEHESLVGDTGHVDSSTRVGRSVVPLGREDLQTSRLSDEVMRIGLGRQTNSVLSPRDLRARVPGHVTFEYRRLTGCDRDFTGRLTDHWSHWMTTDGHACKYTHTHTHTGAMVLRRPSVSSSERTSVDLRPWVCHSVCDNHYSNVTD